MRERVGGKWETDSLDDFDDALFEIDLSSEDKSQAGNQAAIEEKPNTDNDFSDDDTHSQNSLDSFHSALEKPLTSTSSYNNLLRWLQQDSDESDESDESCQSDASDTTDSDKEGEWSDCSEDSEDSDDTQTKQNAYNDKYILALDCLHKLERLWFRIKNNKASLDDKNLFEGLLNEAHHLCSELIPDTSSQLARVKELQRLHGLKQKYDEAMESYIKAGSHKLNRSSELMNKRELYGKASLAFNSLGDFYLSKKFAIKARRRFMETFENPVVEEYNKAIAFKSSPDNKWGRLRKNQKWISLRQKHERDNISEAAQPSVTILINGSYDICLRSNLPSVSREMKRTIIITSSGAYQFKETEGKFVCYLTPEKLCALGLGHYLEKVVRMARRKLDFWEESRESIQMELTSEQLMSLNDAFVAAGGQSIIPDSGENSVPTLSPLLVANSDNSVPLESLATRMENKPDINGNLRP